MASNVGNLLCPVAQVNCIIQLTELTADDVFVSKQNINISVQFDSGAHICVFVSKQNINISVQFDSGAHLCVCVKAEHKHKCSI